MDKIVGTIATQLDIQASDNLRPWMLMERLRNRVRVRYFRAVTLCW